MNIADKYIKEFRLGKVEIESTVSVKEIKRAKKSFGKSSIGFEQLKGLVGSKEKSPFTNLLKGVTSTEVRKAKAGTAHLNSESCIGTKTKKRDYVANAKLFNKMLLEDYTTEYMHHSEKEHKIASELAEKKVRSIFKAISNKAIGTLKESLLDNFLILIK